MPTQNPLSASDILEDITFELAQGSLARDDLAESVESVRRHQQQLRETLLAQGHTSNLREIALKQFQLNDMLLAMLRELALELRAIQLDARRLGELPPRVNPPEGHDTTDAPPRAPIPARGPSPTGGVQPDFDPAFAEPVRRILASEALRVERRVRPVRAPLLGSLLTRARSYIHNLPIFYVRQLSQQQTTINQVLCEAILALTEQTRRMGNGRHPGEDA